MLRALLTLLLLTIAADSRGESLEMLVFNSPGLFDISAQGEISGPGARLLKRIESISGVEFHLREMPVARVVQTVHQQTGSCAAGMARTPEREAFLQWAGPVADSAMVVYGRLDETRVVKGPEGLRGTVIAAQRLSVPAQWLEAHSIQLQEARDPQTALRMLEARRVDFWLVNELLAQHTFRSQGSTPVRALHSFGRIRGYLACHIDTPPATMKRLQGALDQLRRRGELAPFGVR